MATLLTQCGSKGERQPMATTISATALPHTIQQLLEQRKQHAAAIVRIDQTLANVTAALGGATSPVAVSKPAATPVAKAPAVSANKSKRTKFAVSTTQLVLAFVKSHKNPTTSEIMKHVVSQGRTTSAVSNALTSLTQAKKLKRTPVGNGHLGSRYSLS